MKAEEHNLKEEVKEIVDSAIKTEIHNEHCAVFRVLRKDQYSPKGKAILLNNGIFGQVVNECNLCKACEEPFFSSKLCEAFLKARRILVLQKKENPESKQILENIKKTGNVYGIKD